VYRTDGEIVDAALALLRQRGFDVDDCIDVVDGAPQFTARKLAKQDQLSRFILENLEEFDTLEKLDVPLDVATSSVELPSAQFVIPMIRTIGHQIAKGFKVGFSRELNLSSDQ
jgi:hypothetical protein